MYLSYLCVERAEVPGSPRGRGRSVVQVHPVAILRAVFCLQ